MRQVTPWNRFLRLAQQLLEWHKGELVNFTHSAVEAVVQAIIESVVLFVRNAADNITRLGKRWLARRNRVLGTYQ